MRCETPTRKFIHTTNLPSLRRKSTYDRHIRRVDSAKLAIMDTSPSHSEKSTSSYHSELEESLFKGKSVRQYTLEKRMKKEEPECLKRKVRKSYYPIRRFKVPGWDDNFYTQLLDWSYNNFICAASDQYLYFYNMTLQDYFQNSLYRQYTIKNGNQKINAIHFSPTQTKIAIGYDQGSLAFFDYFKSRAQGPFFQHSQRITTIQWHNNMIYTGSRDRTIKTMDSRTMETAFTLPDNHMQQVCGIKALSNHIASGGNDNNVFIYDVRKTNNYLDTYQHSSAVKALEWILPNFLVTGGGAKDRSMKFWKDGNHIIRTVDTGSQVCGLLASQNSDEIVSCQGFSLNQIIIWDLHGKRTVTVHGHQSRVLYSALSPGGRFVATGAGDQALHVWDFFQPSVGRNWPPTVIR